MRIANSEHEVRPWRIREIVPDFTLEDVWALPAHGGAEDFPALIEWATSLDPANARSLPTRVLTRIRFRLGDWFGWDEPGDPLPIPGTSETSLVERLPDDLRGTVADLAFAAVPAVPVYRTDTEFAAEVSNQTVHGVLHLGWADRGNGRYEGQLAIYVKPRGRLGQGYMAFIKPFRYLVVYPALMRAIERAWKTRVPQ